MLCSILPEWMFFSHSSRDFEDETTGESNIDLLVIRIMEVVSPG